MLIKIWEKVVSRNQTGPSRAVSGKSSNKLTHTKRGERERACEPRFHLLQIIPLLEVRLTPIIKASEQTNI